MDNFSKVKVRFVVILCNVLNGMRGLKVITNGNLSNAKTKGMFYVTTLIHV